MDEQITEMPTSVSEKKRPIWDFGKYIDKRLKKMKWSRRELARQTGISAPHMNNIVRGYDPNTGRPPEPSPSFLLAIANRLNVPFDDLLSLLQGKNPKVVKTKDNPSIYDQFFLEMAKQVRELYPAEEIGKKKLESFMRSEAVTRLLSGD